MKFEFKRTSKARQRYPLPQLGSQLVLTEGQSGWLWEVRVYRGPVTNGISPTVEDAKRAGFNAWRQYSEEYAAIAGPRLKSRNRMKYYMKQRPHLIMACCAAALMPMLASKYWVRDACESESRWWDLDPDPQKKPLTWHPLAKPAKEVARLFYQDAVALGLIKKQEDGSYSTVRLRKWANDYFGPIFDGDAKENFAALAREVADGRDDA